MRDFEKFAAELREGKHYKGDLGVRTVIEANLRDMKRFETAGNEGAVRGIINGLRTWSRVQMPKILAANVDIQRREETPSFTEVREYIEAVCGPDHFIGPQELKNVFPDAFDDLSLPDLPSWEMIEKHAALGHVLRLRLPQIRPGTLATIDAMQTHMIEASLPVELRVGADPEMSFYYEETPGFEWVFTQSIIDPLTFERNYREQIDVLVDFVFSLYPDDTPDDVSQRVGTWLQASDVFRSMSKGDEDFYKKRWTESVRSIDLNNQHRPTAVSLVQDLLVDLCIASEERKKELTEPNEMYFSSSFGAESRGIDVYASDADDKYFINVDSTDIVTETSAYGRFEERVSQEPPADTETPLEASSTADHA